jgi:hypothetical protein
VAEKAEVVLVLVCHTSERQRFSSDKLAHIYTRIASLVELKKASLDDCGLYLRELCEVGVDEGVIAKAFEDSGGRYRLLANACKTLEAIAGKLGKAGLTQEDIKNIRLCEDAMKTIRGGKKGGSE